MRSILRCVAHVWLSWPALQHHSVGCTLSLAAEVYGSAIATGLTAFCSQHGDKSAALRFTQELGHCVTESSVRNMKKAYLRVLKTLTRLLVHCVAVQGNANFSGC